MWISWGLHDHFFRAYRNHRKLMVNQSIASRLAPAPRNKAVHERPVGEG